MTNGPIRVRIAPSPTGDPHVGTAYQALFNYVFAKGQGGQFILRIEDTDRARSSSDSERAILESLRWLGLQWDEGPDVGGPFAPYRQSERLEIYRKHVDVLLEAGHAYRCFCTKERLDRIRAENRDRKLFPGYDRHCRGLSQEETKARMGAAEPSVVRMKVPISGICQMHDMLRGEIQREWASIDDQVILKSDGFPTYHLANVVDDHLMGITHVIRGEEWINSLPKHIQLYLHFGFEPPAFCHLPLLRNTDRSKLSKRKNPTSILYFRRAGFLPEALLNFLALMGWSFGEDNEKFQLEEMVRQFRLEDMTLGGPVFDVQKLRWLNGRYIREDHNTESLRARLEEWSLNAENFGKIIPLAQPRMETLSDWGYLTAFFFADAVPIDPEELVLKGKTSSELAMILLMTIWQLEQQKDFASSSIEASLREMGEKMDIKLRDLLVPFYVAITGSKASTPIFQSMEILGSDMARMRLRQAVQALGGISGKRMKEIEKNYAKLFTGSSTR